MRLFASGQFRYASSATVELLSREPTSSQMRMGFLAVFGINVAWYSHAPRGYSLLFWMLTNVPE
ncbi:hypothetical protein D3C83_263580 [compost metagenome]